jgi:OOP family OmpA-OmpF porin
MAVFDTLIGDTASRFGLGSNAGQLVRETLNMVANAPGGIAGFLGKLEAAGLRSEMQSWLGHPNAAPLSAQDLDRALGSGALSGIANRLGIAETAVKTAVGYTLPKLIGALTPGGRIPTSLPAEVETFLSSRVAEPGTRPVSGSAERFVERRTAPESLGVIQNESTMSRWRLPLVGALAALAIGALLYNRTPVAPDIAQAPSALPAIAEDVKTAAATVTESVQRGANLALTEQAAKACGQQTTRLANCRPISAAS